MKTLILAAIRYSLMFTAVAALSLAYPASIQAVPTTYQYRGNPFTNVQGDYTTNDFVTAMVTLAAPLPPNSDVVVHPTAFTFSDGVQTLTNTTPFIDTFFNFQTNASGEITVWHVDVNTGPNPHHFFINTSNLPGFVLDGVGGPGIGSAFINNSAGHWTQASATPDVGSTLSLMTLTLMALGLVARRFQRAAA